MAQADDCFESAKPVEIIKDSLAVANFWLEKGVKWRYSSSGLQGGWQFYEDQGKQAHCSCHRSSSAESP